MRVMNKKWIGTAAAAALAGVMMIGGTFAFLTDSAAKNNTFTVGNVDIEVEEPHFPTDGSNENIVPLQKVTKDPQVVVKTQIPTIVFMKVTVPKKNIRIYNTDTQDYDAAQSREIYNILTGGDSGFNSNWIQLAPSSEDETDTYKSYTFGYKTVMNNATNNGTTSALFDQVQLKNIMNADNIGDIDIKIDAYAIQASYVADADVAKEAGDELGKDELTTIFNMYNKQPSRTYTADASASTNPTSDTTSTGDSSDSGNTQTQDPQDPDTNPSTGE